MLNVSISIIDVSEDPAADVLTLDDGSPFIALRLGTDATVMLPGFGSVAAAYARDIASALTEAAAQCDDLAVPAATPVVTLTPTIQAIADEEIF